MEFFLPDIILEFQAVFVSLRGAIDRREEVAGLDAWVES
jgi:hypothetical protein